MYKIFLVTKKSKAYGFRAYALLSVLTRPNQLIEIYLYILCEGFGIVPCVISHIYMGYGASMLFWFYRVKQFLTVLMVQALLRTCPSLIASVRASLILSDYSIFCGTKEKNIPLISVKRIDIKRNCISPLIRKAHF